MKVQIFDDNDTLVGTVEVGTDAMRLVRHRFNPSGLSGVGRIKILAAAFIQACEDASEDGRETAVARTLTQQASMMGVAAATAKLYDEEQETG